MLLNLEISSPSMLSDLIKQRKVFRAEDVHSGSFE